MRTKQPLTEEQVTEILAESNRRTALRARQFGENSSILAELHPKQRAVAEDTSRAISVLGDRRSGKTFVVANVLEHTSGQGPGLDQLYLNPTAKQARLIMWEGPDQVPGPRRVHRESMGRTGQTW